MLIYVVKQKGLLQPLVDLKAETGRMYIPYWKNREVLVAQDEGVRRGYTCAGAKLAYITYPTYQKMKEDLNILCRKANAGQKFLMELNPLHAVEIPTWAFMAQNQNIFQGAGDMLIEGGDGECVIVDDETAAAIMAQYDAEHPEDEDYEDEDDDGYDDYEDDEYEEEEEVKDIPTLFGHRLRTPEEIEEDIRREMIRLSTEGEEEEEVREPLPGPDEIEARIAREMRELAEEDPKKDDDVSLSRDEIIDLLDHIRKML